MSLVAKGTVLRLGLTGGIGSGKSTVASVLADLGAHVIDADAISRGTTQSGGSAIEPIKAHFGVKFIEPSGALNRSVMREHIFAHPAARTLLESIIHPLVGAEIARQVQSSDAACMVFDVPLLVESPHWCKQLDRVWVVDCSTDTQIIRVQARNGWAKSTVEDVIATQAPRHVRLAAADAVIFNDGLSMSSLHIQVKRLAAEFGL